MQPKAITNNHFNSSYQYREGGEGRRGEGRGGEGREGKEGRGGRERWRDGRESRDDCCTYSDGTTIFIYNNHVTYYEIT